MEGLIQIIIVLFLLLTGARPSPEPPTALPESEASFRSLTIIDSVDALILESFPAQIRLHVTGSQPDGCDFPVQVEQRRDGNTIIVEIFREMSPAVMCPAVLRFYDDTIALDGSFESGTYTIIVNDYTLDVTV